MFPLSEKAVEEASTLMLASKNLLKPADGEPIISPSKDMVLGVFYLTMDMDGDHKGDGRAFYSIDEVQYSYDMGLVDLHAKIKFQVETYYDTDGKRLPQPEMRLVDTTVGRVIFNNILPPEMRFKNVILDKGAIKDLISEVYQVCDQEVTTEVADSIKDIGFEFSMRSGATIAVSDITIPETKNTMLRMRKRSRSN
jgi:DNA-directed RNA polymerase subunit beta'